MHFSTLTVDAHNLAIPPKQRLSSFNSLKHLNTGYMKGIVEQNAVYIYK